MTDEADAMHALDLVRDGGFSIGPQWAKAHEIAQAHEGVPAFDWIHALCHRIEGDDWNADYWYRRAGRERSSGKVEDEWRHMRETLTGG